MATVTMENLVRTARDLCGNSESENPEYTRALVELLASLLPGGTDHARDYVHSLITQ